jgi:hypothetical protein
MIRCTALSQAPDGKQRRLSGEPTAGERDDDDQQRDDAERRTEARQQIVARLGALPTCTSVPSARRADTISSSRDPTLPGC